MRYLHREWIPGKGFSSTALQLLLGQIDMADTADFCYLLPHYASIISQAHGQMERNDYLLLIALLSLDVRFGSADPLYTDELDPTKLNYRRFRWNCTDSEENFEMFFDGAYVGHYIQGFIRVSPDATSVLLGKLGYDAATIERCNSATPSYHSTRTQDDEHEMKTGIVWIDLTQPADTAWEEQCAAWFPSLPDAASGLRDA